MFLNALPETSRDVFDYCAADHNLASFILIGGTALALQINHRLSYDLDFAVFTPQLPVQAISKWLSGLQGNKIPVQNITSANSAAQFRINTGELLQNYAQDYEVAGVKVTFFAHGKNQQQRKMYQTITTIKASSSSFAIMGVEGLKITKTMVLADRVRSRDLFDLMTLMKTQKLTLNDMKKWVEEFGHNNDFQHYLSVLSGQIPLDEDDEGLQPTGTAVSISDIYNFFNNEINKWQIQQAFNTATNKPI